MLIVGLTGGIASGKSLVGKELLRMGAETINCDEIVQGIYEKKEVRRKLISEFGGEIASERGIINRRRLAEIVFSDSEKLKKLNSLIHPLVFDEVKERAEKLKERNFEGIVVVEIPLLFESGMQEFFDRTITISSPKEKRLERLISQNFSKEEAEARINSQMSDEERIKMADYAIDNDKGPEKLITETRNLYKKLEGLI